MTKKLNPEQLDKIVAAKKRSRKPLGPPLPESWNPEFDASLEDLIAGPHREMPLGPERIIAFNDRYGALDPKARAAYHLIFGSRLLGGPVDAKDVPLAISIAENSTSGVVRGCALDTLQLCLRDCSGDDAHKPKIKQILAANGAE